MKTGVGQLSHELGVDGGTSRSVEVDVGIQEHCDTGTWGDYDLDHQSLTAQSLITLLNMSVLHPAPHGTALRTVWHAGFLHVYVCKTIPHSQKKGAAGRIKYC